MVDGIVLILDMDSTQYYLGGIDELLYGYRAKLRKTKGDEVLPASVPKEEGHL